MKENKFIIASTISTFVSLVVIKMANLINSAIKARFLGPELLGVLAILYSMQSMFNLFTSMAVPTALTKFISEYSVEKRKIEMYSIFSTTLIATLIFSIVLSAIIFASADWIAISIYHREDMIFLVKLIAISIIPTAFSVIFEGSLNGVKKISASANINLITSLINVPILYIFVLKYGVLGAVLAIFTSLISSSVLKAYILFKTFANEGIKLRLTFDKSLLKSLLTFVLPILISQTFIIPSMWFGKTYISTKFGFDTVGLYSIGEVITQPLLFFALAISKPLLPHWSSNISAGINESERRKIFNLVKKIGLITIASVILLLLSIGPLINLVYGKQYSESIYIAYFFIIYTAMSAINTTLTNLWYARNMTKFLMLIDFAGVITFLVTLVVFVHIFGEIGLILAQIMNSYMYMLLSAIKLCKEGITELSVLYLEQAGIISLIGFLYILSPFGEVMSEVLLLIVALLICIFNMKEISDIVKLVIGSLPLSFNK